MAYSSEHNSLLSRHKCSVTLSYRLSDFLCDPVWHAPLHTPRHVLGFKGLCEGSTAVTSSGHPVKQLCQRPAALLCLMSGYFDAVHCCSSCFQCSAMWKINSSGYSTSTGQSKHSLYHYPFPFISLFLLLSVLHTQSSWHFMCTISTQHPSTPLYQQQPTTCTVQ